MPKIKIFERVKVNHFLYFYVSNMYYVDYSSWISTKKNFILVIWRFLRHFKFAKTPNFYKWTRATKSKSIPYIHFYEIRLNHKYLTIYTNYGIQLQRFLFLKLTSFWFCCAPIIFSRFWTAFGGLKNFFFIKIFLPIFFIIIHSRNIGRNFL